MSDLKDFGPIIKRLRLEAGMTQEELCEATNYKLQPGYLSQLERSPRSLSVPILMAICEALGTSIADIIREVDGGEKTVVAQQSIPVLDAKGEQTGSFLSIPMRANIDSFAYVVNDESMQTDQGISYFKGGYIIATKTDSLEANKDYIFKIDGFLVAAEYKTDGRRHILSYKNAMYPSETLPNVPKALGIITGFIYF